jgi:hypothetical protein
MASQTRQRVQYQGTLERQAQEDQLKREGFATRDTPEAKFAREQLKVSGANFRNLTTNQQRQYHTDMQKVMADNNQFQRAADMLERQAGLSAAELLKDYRAKIMADPNYKGNDDELGAMARAHDMLFTNRQAPTPAAGPQAPIPNAPNVQVAPAPAAPAPAAAPVGGPRTAPITSPPTTPAAPGKRWIHNPVTGEYRQWPP